MILILEILSLWLIAGVITIGLLNGAKLAVVRAARR